MDSPHSEEVPRDVLERAMATRTPAWKPMLTVLLLVGAVAGIVGIGAMPRLDRQEALKKTNQTLQSLARRVQLGTIRLSPESRSLTLSASLQPNAQADLYAQAIGFVRERRVDIGDRVKAGDVLAVIDIPLVDEDLNRAKALLLEAEANRAEVDKSRSLAKVSLDRWLNVDPPGAVSKQEIDERQSAFESAEAAFNAAQAVVATRAAEVQRLERQQAFARVVAPFDGTITARGIEIGDYISNAGPGTTPMFSLADTQTLRVYADVPQTFALSISPGQSATVSVRELGGRKLQGTVTRTSGVLNERTRTLRVEVSVPNESGDVLAGAYGQVEFEVKQPVRSVIVPGSSLLVRREGPRVAIVDDSNRMRYIAVAVGRDLGTEVELTSGLTGNERVVVNMADEIPEGTEVEPVAPAKPN